MRLARGALAAYEQHYGPYGAPELDVVLGTFTAFGGMEYPQLVLTTPQFGPVRHEIAHQWFYGIVGDDQRHAPWLDESFALVARARPVGLPRLPLAARARRAGRVPRLDHVRCSTGAPTCTAASSTTAAPARSRRRPTRSVTTAFRALLKSYVAVHRYGITTEADFISALRAAAPPASTSTPGRRVRGLRLP